MYRARFFFSLVLYFSSSLLLSRLLSFSPSPPRALSLTSSLYFPLLFFFFFHLSYLFLPLISARSSLHAIFLFISDLSIRRFLPTNLQNISIKWCIILFVSLQSFSTNAIMKRCAQWKYSPFQLANRWIWIKFNYKPYAEKKSAIHSPHESSSCLSKLYSKTCQTWMSMNRKANQYG